MPSLPRPPAAVLVVGDNTAAQTISFAERGYHPTLLVTDAAALLAVRRALIPLPFAVQNRIQDIATGTLADLTRFATAHFDVAWLVGVSDESTPELQRVLKPGGHVVVHSDASDALDVDLLADQP